MKFLTILLSVSLILVSCQDSKKVEYTLENIQIIPQPQQQITQDGFLTLSKNITVVAEEHFTQSNGFLARYLTESLGWSVKTIKEEQGADIVFKFNSTLGKEEYVLTIGDQISIEAENETGAFYAIQSLIQIVPQANAYTSKHVSTKIAKVTIKDAPRFSYRGMHLDVSRHFFPKKFIKEYIDHLAMLKMNTFHWHLTDDQGWRIEIKQYPDLTTKGGFREETLIGHYNDTPQQFDGKRYGGFYTQEDIKEIVAYATARHITVIPEIEMPGHAQAAIHAYPSLGCTGDQVPVATKWGVFENIYCPKEETFTFLKNVLDEVMPLFPSQYIHIGGDEAPKERWKNCQHCQQLITEKNLKDEHGLQSYFIKKIEAHVNSKGKKIIGWDEILEGGLAPNATVMSWRGTQGAVDAANEGHDVILTPTSHAYFDHYQATYEDEPTAIGGYLPLKKVYSFNPIPKKIQGTDAATHVLGAQGNIWTEYMTTEDQVEYMAFPRILAMAEVTWSGPTENLEEDYAEFLTRVEPLMERLDGLQINYANHLFTLEGAIEKKAGDVLYTLKTPTSGKEIKYSSNNSKEQPYNEAIAITENTTIKAQVYKDGNPVGRILVDTINYHKGINASVSLNLTPHPSFSAGGKEALINGITGSNTRFGDKEWLGFWGDDLEITIIFDKATKINKISTRFYNANGQWLYAPKSWEAITTLESGAILKNELLLNSDKQILDTEMNMGTKKYLAKKIVLRIPNYGTIPDGFQGAGNKAWTFIDEIIIE